MNACAAHRAAAPAACYTRRVRFASRILRVSVVACLLGVGAAPCGASLEANQPSTTYLDKPAGFSITIPKTWELIPRSVASVESLIKQLDAKKQTELAKVYTAIIDSTAGRAELQTFVFQAFLYPPISPIQTQVNLGIVRTTTVYSSRDLMSVGETFAKEFSSTKGAKISKPKVVKLPAGPAAFIEGTEPAGGGLRSGIELYIIPHGKLLYELAFQTDARALSSATVFTAVADLFRFA